MRQKRKPTQDEVADRGIDMAVIAMQLLAQSKVLTEEQGKTDYMTSAAYNLRVAAERIETATGLTPTRKPEEEPGT